MHVRSPLLLALILTACTADSADTGDASTSDASTVAADDSTSGTTEAVEPTTAETSAPTSDTTTDPTNDPTNDPSGDDTTDDTTDATTDAPPNGCGLVEPACVDEAIQDLSLHDDKVSEGDVSSEKDGGDWVSVVDATAGGTPNAPMNPWIYLRFTADGLEKVAIDDLTAFESADWDIAAKRFGIRVNSGTGGPSCVTVAAPGGAYADVTAAPAADQFAKEAFYTADCKLIEDNSGLAGNPAYLTATWWGYTGCVTTTGEPFVLQLADGSFVKLVVEQYYGSGQEECNASGAMGSMSAMMTWRWSFL